MGSSTRNNPVPVPKRNGVSPKRNNQILSIFNRFHDLGCNIKNLKLSFEILVYAWEELVNSPSELSVSVYKSLFEHTLRFVLRGEWQRNSIAAHTHLQCMVQRFRILVEEVTENGGSAIDQLYLLETLISEPWSHPVLKKILNNEDQDLFDILQYFELEFSNIIVVRLEMLLQERCEDMALKLSKSYLQAHRNSEGCSFDFNQNDLDYISDIYYCSLFKNKMQDVLITEIKLLKLNEGLHLLKRYRKNDGIGKEFNHYCKDARIWKYNHKVVELIADTLLTKATLNDSLIDSDTILPELLAEWAAIYKLDKEEKLPEIALKIMKKLIIAASSSRCIYPFCAYLIELNGFRNIDAIVLEWLIRAINENINEIEQHRVRREYLQLESAHERLANAFVMVSKLFSNCVHICRECLLTSFSLLPSPERLAVLETFVTVAIKKPILESSNETVPSLLESTLRSMDSTESSDVNVIPAYYAELQDLDITENVKLDLNTILRYHRCRSLSWELTWSDLKNNCLGYLESFKAHGFSDDVELKFLNLDYNQFKNKPINYEGYIGIEKGYEHCLPLYNEPEVPSWNVSSDYDQPSSSDDSDEDYVETNKRGKKSRKRKKRTRESDFSVCNGLSEDKNSTKFSGTRLDRKKKKHRSFVDSSAYEMKTRKKRARQVQLMSVTISENLPPDVDENGCEAERKQFGIKRKLRSSFQGKLFKVCEPNCEDVDILSANGNLVNKVGNGKRLTLRIKKQESDKVGRSNDFVRMTECEVVLRRLHSVETEHLHLLNKELPSTVDSLESPKNSSPVACSSSSSLARNKSESEVESQKSEHKSFPIVRPIILRKVPSKSNALIYEIANS